MSGTKCGSSTIAQDIGPGKQDSQIPAGRIVLQLSGQDCFNRGMQPPMVEVDPIASRSG